jgi:hypothetical protein
VSVQFYCDDTKVGEPVVTDGQGRAAMKFSGLEKGVRRFEVRIEGTLKGAVQPKTLKEDKPKRPAKFLLRKSGGNGTYHLVFQVLTAEDEPVGKAVVRIMGPGTESKDLAPTGKDGTATYDAQFEEKHRILTAFVLGSALKKDIHLFNYQQKGENSNEMDGNTTN